MGASVCVRDGRPGPISLVVAASEHTMAPPQSLQEGTSLLPQLPQIKGSFVIWLHHPCPPLPALKIQSPFLTSHSPAPYPLPLPVCRGSSTDLLLSLPQGSLLSSCLPSASPTAYQNQFTVLVQFWSALSSSVL